MFSGSEVLVATVPGHEYAEVLATGWQLIFGTILPFIIILGCNVAIIVTLNRAANERSKLKGQGQSLTKTSTEKETQFLIRMLVLVSLAYVLTSIPYRLYNMILDSPEMSHVYKMDEPYWSVRYSAQHYILNCFWFCNYALNYYLYCIGGGKQYRKDTLQVLKVFCSCC